MESSRVLPSGILVDVKNHNYKFYYKPLQSNFAKKTRKEQKYKCYLHLTIFAPQHIHVQDFDCKARGSGKGDGKFLFCEALKYLKTKLELNPDALVSLTAISVVKPTKNEGPHVVQDKLISYYNKTYGFGVLKEDQVMNIYRTDMSTTLKTILDKCSIVKKTMRQKISNMLGFLKRK